MNMNMFRILNRTIVLLLLVISIYYFGNVTTAFKNLDIVISNRSFVMFILVFLLFIVTHLIKSIRFYLILFESRIKFSEFIELYVKTTFLNILLPFKLGELIRVYVFGKTIKNYQTGFLSVITDRFFDTCILLLVIIPYGLTKKEVAFSSILLLFFVFAVAFSFIIFPPTYRYLNEFIILNKTSKRAMKMLQLLESCKMIYDFEKKLLKGRTAVLIMLSAIAWLLEFIMLLCLGYGINKNFGLNVFVDYLSSALFIHQNEYLVIYTFIGAIVFGVTVLALFIFAGARRGLAYGKPSRNSMDL